MLWWDGQRWRDADLAVPPSDGGFVHFLLFLLVTALAYLSVALIVGYVLIPLFGLRRTGRRARDVWMLFIPVWGAVVLVQTFWRLAARRMYWLPRRDLFSKPLFGPGILPKDAIPAAVLGDINY
jgi:hypothetical protein